MSVNERISMMRKLMREHGLSAYIVRGTDPHASEYMADHWKEITWISGFKGETGTVLITLDESFLWTDSRYYLQADKELASSEVQLMKESEIDTPTIAQWLCQKYAGKKAKVGVNAEMLTVRAYEELSNELQGGGLKLVSIDLVKPLWTDSRPPIPQEQLYAYSTRQKLQAVRQAMAEKGATVFITSALDEIAWLLNIRGNDVAFNPVVISYVVVEKNSCTLFVSPDKLNQQSISYLIKENVALQDYDNIVNRLKMLEPDNTVLFDGTRLNRALYEALPAACRKIDAQSPVLLLKSMKNEVEMEGERIAMRQDAVALTRFFKWLEQEAFAEGKELTEYDLMRRLHEFRAMGNNFVEESFETIAGYEGNGAIVHYEATKEDCARVYPTGMLLLDSGGQYLDGTTDITRTVWLGAVPQEGDDKYNEFKQAQHDYTLVLKGHIALACAKFPKGTRGNQLDALAKQYMWQDGITFGHGTGHGVGHFLGCHEGPQNIRTDLNPAPLRLGNICSDEPGIYRTNEHGIRIENLIAVIEAPDNGFGEFYQFETLTLCYYDTSLIDMSMLTPQERNWINTYHKMVETAVCPLLNAEEAAWLENKCKAI